MFKESQKTNSLDNIESFLSKVKPVSEYLDKASSERQEQAELKTAILEEERKAAYKKGYDQGKTKGFQFGHNEGFEAAYQESKEKYTDEINAFAKELQSKTDKVINLTQDWYQRAEEKLADLAIEIVTRLIKQELKTNKECALSIAKDAVKEAIEKVSIKIRINPFDQTLLSERKDEILAIVPTLKQIEIVEDPYIIGGCIIETNDSIIDARIEQMILNVVKTLREAR